ncbi:MAG: oxidoreductase [Bacteroidetes bacterium]|nr:oxidoreductase [Bacteroidota bacterium]
MEDKFENSGVIRSVIDLSPSVKHYIVEVNNQNTFDFIPGQFVIISFPEIHHAFPYRSYSIASAPEKNTFELCVVLKEDGAASPLLFHMYEGNELRFSAPQGKFVLPEEIEGKTFCFICTGTGVAPFRSMIQYMVKHKLPFEKIYLIFGGRKQEDLLYRDEFEALAANDNRIEYIPVLSREEWQGYKGYLHQVYLNKPEFTGKENMQFYICGWSGMVKEAKNNLKEMGYSRKEIKFELFD